MANTNQQKVDVAILISNKAVWRSITRQTLNNDKGGQSEGKKSEP